MLSQLVPDPTEPVSRNLTTLLPALRFGDRGDFKGDTSRLNWNAEGPRIKQSSSWPLAVGASTDP